MNSLSRLKRPIIGERLFRTSGIVDRAAKRSDIRPPQIELPDHTRDLEYRVRPNRRQIDPHPNAPQLIRLNRNPFPLHRGSFSKIQIPTMSLARPDRQPVAALVAEARDAYIKAELSRPTDAHIRPAPRPRPSASEWLAGKGMEFDREK